MFEGEDIACVCVLAEDALALEQSMEGFGAKWKGVPRSALLRDLRELLVRYFEYGGTCEDCEGGE